MAWWFSLCGQILQIFSNYVSTEAVTTTELTPVNDGLKKNWHDSWRTCCKESKVLYEKGMDVDSGNFNLTREMVGQEVDEIYLNDKLVPGDFIIPMGEVS